MAQSELPPSTEDGGAAPPSAPDGPDASHRRFTRAERWGATLTAIGILVALGAWLFPRHTGGPSSAPTTSQIAPTGTGTATTPTADPGRSGGPPPALTYLDSLSPESGSANLTKIPRPIADQAGYGHPIVVACPSNQSGDQVREVTYLLRGRYLDFSATIRPYFVNAASNDARTDITAIAVFKQRDDSLTRQEKGRQYNAMVATPAPLTATVDGAEKLTLQVRCEEPEGAVVFVDAGLSRAPS